MGVAGLLKSLKSITIARNISEYAGCTAGIDAYSWLYKGLYSCCVEVAQNGHQGSTKYIEYCMRRIDLLQANNVEPFLVFDGNSLPAKEHKNDERRAQREHNKHQGAKLLQAGNVAAARQCFSKAVQVTPAMCVELIKVGSILS